jgi:thymidylate synthase
LRKGLQRVGTVANTIFPEAYLRGYTNRQQVYDRYLASLPRLRKQTGNGKGTYFERLIKYPATKDVRHGGTFNQLEALIQKLDRQLRSNGPKKRFTYQAQIFIPNQDTMSTMGFPCMSFVSFQLDGDKRLCLTALYRNQYYFERALGNFVGLARLQRFVADATNLGQGSLAVHAFHAKIDTLGKRETEQLIQICREHTSLSLEASRPRVASVRDWVDPCPVSQDGDKRIEVLRHECAQLSKTYHF